MQFQSIASAAAPTNPAPFVRADLTLDIAAIKAVAKARYALKRPAFVSFPPATLRGWCRRILRDVRNEATDQRHRIVWAQLPSPLPFTKAEEERREVLAGVMAFAPITARGNAEYKRASGEYGEIGRAAQRRVYDAILAEARRAQ